MPLLTITLVRTISFTIYETTKRVGQAGSQRKTQSEVLSIRTEIGKSCFESFQPRQPARQSDPWLLWRGSERTPAFSRDMRIRAGQSQIATGILDIVRGSDTLGQLVQVADSRYRKQRGIPYQPHGTFSGGALVRLSCSSAVVKL